MIRSAASSLTDFDSKSLATLSADDAVNFFGSLLWCAARRASIPLDSITISNRTNTPDGGIDAEVSPNAITQSQDLLIAGNSFFQIKAGTSATPWQKAWLRKELFGKASKPTKAALGDRVRHCLEQNGRYVIICFGCDPIGRQRTQAKRYLRDLFSSCGYKNAQVDICGQSTLAGMAQPFPSLVLRLSDRHHLPFLTFDDWQVEFNSKRLHLGKPQEKLVKELQADVRGGSIRHIRLIGEPGLGKTRLTLEALSAPDLAPTVVYIRHPEDFERSPLFNTIIRSDDASSITIVVDDCPPKERASIWSVLRPRSERITLITLDHGPEDSSDELMRVIDCPPLEANAIKAILADYIGQDHDLDRWADFCSGSPRVAHAVGDNLKHNPGDILKPPASVPIWERFIHGNSRSGSHDEAQKVTALRHVALFHKFGFEHPVDDEAKFIASLVNQADPTITHPKFQSIIKHFRDRRIIQGKTTLFIVPRALHIHLWLQFWEHYGHGTDVAGLLTRMPQSLFRWFIEMFKYGHASPGCLAQIERLTSTGGPFDAPSFITSGPGATFLNELAEAHPEATLRCIERTIGMWSHDDLLQFNQHRQYIVWALEKIAIWKHLFCRSVAMLLRLAIAENGKNSNNATGTFCELFSMGYDRLASSEAPPDIRRPALEAALSAPDRVVRSIALKAAARALADHPYSKMVGPERQGLRPLPALWMPKTYGEVYNAYRANLRLILNFWRSTTGDDKSEAAHVIIKSALWMVRARPLEDDAMAALWELRRDPTTDLKEIVRLVGHCRMLNWQGLSRKTARNLRDLDRDITGSALRSQIIRFVLLGTHDDIDRTGSKPYGQRHTERIRGLARKALRESSVLVDLLPSLLGQDGFAQQTFGWALGVEDKAFDWWPRLVIAFTASGNKNPDLLAGYLSAMHTQNSAQWEDVILEALGNDVFKPHAHRLALRSGFTERVLDAVCNAVAAGTVSSEALAGLGHARQRCGLSVERTIEFVAWCLEHKSPEITHIGLDVAYVLFCFDKAPPSMPEQPILDLLRAPTVLESMRHASAHYYWSELTKEYIRHYPQHAILILESVLDRFDDSNFLLEFSFSQAQTAIHDVIRVDPKGSWRTVSKRLESSDGMLNWKLAHWLGPRSFSMGTTVKIGPLSLFEISDVLEWVAVNPEERAPFIMREAPKTLLEAEGGALTRELLIRYGDKKGVQSALWANFGTGGWSGRASDHHRKIRDTMRKLLANETERPVIQWLEDYIDYLSRQIVREEMEEEREF